MGCCCSTSATIPTVVDTHHEPPLKSQPRTVVALHDYNSNDKEELSFIKGDKMLVIDDTDPDWLFVQHSINDQKGYVRSNFVAPSLSLESEDWFFANTSRKEAEKLLLNDINQPRGTFLIRPSEHNSSGYSLSVKDWDTLRKYHVKHYRIKQISVDNNSGFYITALKTFNSISELVAAYTEQENGICYILKRPCRKPEPTIWNLHRTDRDTWEIPHCEIKLIRQLGRGNFGEVYYGMWQEQYEVAVKTLRQGTMSTESFLQEAAIMKKFRHKRLVCLWGVSTSPINGQIYIIQEYMEKGNLLDNLRADNGQIITFNDLLYFAYQIAEGMAFLESKHFIHRDLAARNCLLGLENQVKIADFGLARNLCNESIYITNKYLPVKWSAPESLTNGECSIKSDVWSFGVLLMELFTYGAPPYDGKPSETVYALVCNGYKMEKPKTVSTNLYKVMLECWQTDPTKRPTFKDLMKRFVDKDASKYEQHTIKFIKQ